MPPDGATMLDFVLDYRCQVRCDYCTIEDAWLERRLSLDAVLRWLRAARAQGYGSVRFGGGEPTIRPDFPRMAAAARALGYDPIKLHSNGLRLFYEPYLDAVLRAGVSHVNVTLMGPSEESYRVTLGRGDACGFAFGAVEHLARRGVSLEVDVVMRALLQGRLRETLQRAFDAGARLMNLWLLSLTDRARSQAATLPRLCDLAPEIMACLDWARQSGARVLVYHVPACFLPGYEEHLWSPLDRRILVVDPNQSFTLERSQLSGGAYVEACQACSRRARCLGLRPDYLERHGGGEVRALRAPVS